MFLGGVRLAQAQVGFAEQQVRSRGSRVQSHGALQVRGSLGQAIQRQEHAPELQVGSRRIGVALKGALQERDGFLRLTLAEEEDAVIDAWVLVGWGAAIQSDGFAESFARFGGAAQTLLAESNETPCFSVL